MKIAYVGNYTNFDNDGKSYNTENHLALTLEKMGHEVVRIQEMPTYQGHDWLNLVRGCDLFLYTRTWGNMVTISHLDQIKSMGIPTASYHLDLYVGLSRQSGIETDPFWRTEFVFSADGDPESQKFFESKGINHYWLMPGVFEDECIMLEPNGDEGLSGDVIFVGGGVEYGHPEWPYRYQLVEWLKETYGPRYKKYGSPERTVRGTELNQLYANSKIAIGDSVNIGFNHTNYTSDRLFESMGRGAFTIYPRIEGIAGLFDEGVNAEFYTYGDFEELQRKIDYYLANPDVRERIRLAGFEEVKANHTYTQRLSRMLDIILDEAHMTKPVLHPEGKSKTDDRSVKVNLGAGTDILEGWINVDLVPLEGIDKVHNLAIYPWPLEDNSATDIRAVDVLEHLPNYTEDLKPGVIAFIEECHRILKPGGTLFIQTPGWRAEFLWIDPTHVRGFDIKTMDFFDPTTHYGTTTGFYSDCKFKVRAEELDNHNIRFWMEKI